VFNRKQGETPARDLHQAGGDEGHRQEQATHECETPECRNGTHPGVQSGQGEGEGWIHGHGGAPPDGWMVQRKCSLESPYASGGSHGFAAAPPFSRPPASLVAQEV